RSCARPSIARRKRFPRSRRRSFVCDTTRISRSKRSPRTSASERAQCAHISSARSTRSAKSCRTGEPRPRGMTMKTHYTEADLLETYYTQPGESMPVMMHLAQCSECAARYERLERKLRDAASCDVERPDTFWSRQRHLIM